MAQNSLNSTDWKAMEMGLCVGEGKVLQIQVSNSMIHKRHYFNNQNQLINLKKFNLNLTISYYLNCNQFNRFTYFFYFIKSINQKHFKTDKCNEINFSFTIMLYLIEINLVLLYFPFLAAK